MATAAVGALAVLGGQWLAGRQQAHNQDRLERSQERQEGQRRRERAAQVLGDVTALLIDAEAIRIGGITMKGRVNLETLMKSQGTFVTRLGQLRGQLLALSTGHPSADVRTLASQLESALGQYLQTIWMAFALPQQAGLHRPVSESGPEYAEANRLLRELIEAVDQHSHKLVSRMRADARLAAGPAESSVLHDFARSGPTKEVHQRALYRLDGLLSTRSGAGHARFVRVTRPAERD